MAFVSFYMIGGGAGSSDINAGSSIGAAQATTTNGNWNSGTGVFIAASGTPFAATTTADYASVYVDGATVTTFVGKVTTVTSSVQITIDIASIKYGTAPSTSATGRSCTINGSWSTPTVVGGTGLATTTVPQSTKINIKQATYTLGVSLTVSMAGATTAPLWFSGYHTTPGDLDNDTTNALTKPVWNFNGNFIFNCTGAHQLWTGLSVLSARNTAMWQLAGGNSHISRCRAENTSANAGATGISLNGGNLLSYSWIKVPSTSTTTPVVQMTGAALLVGVVAEGGANASFDAGAQSVVYNECISLNSGGVGFLGSTAAMRLLNCTISNSTGDGVKWTGTPTGNASVVACLFRAIGSNVGINNASGTNTNNVYRACNGFYSCTTQESGFGDSPAFFPQTLTTDPCVSNSNMTPVAGSPSALSNGFPGIFENESFSSYQDIGAVAIAGGGGYTPQVFS